MGHGFDDQGAKSDARGVLHTWWAPEDTAAFKKRTDSLAAQYDEFTVLPGLKVNGRLTLGENIGDLGGISVAYDAYHRSLHGSAPPVLDGHQRRSALLPLVGAGVARLDRDEAIRSQVLERSAQPGAVPRQRRGAQRRCLVRRLRRQPARQALPAAR